MRARRRSRLARWSLAAIAGLLLTVAVSQTPPGAASGGGSTSTGAGRGQGWHQLFADRFTGHTLDRSKWVAYSGQPGGAGSRWTGWWAPEHIEVRDGIAVLRAYRDARNGNRWTSAGMSTSRSLAQTFGKYEVRFRMDPGYGISFAVLLWPVAKHWPPEIDIAENAGTDGGRSSMAATVHLDAERYVQRDAAVDLSAWHTVGVEWTPGELVYTLDGAAWGAVSGSDVPAEPMYLALQTLAGAGDRWRPTPDASTPPEVDMQVDWVTGYTRTP